MASVLLWKEPLDSYKKQVRELLSKKYENTIVLQSECLPLTDNADEQTIFGFLISIARKLKLIKSWQTTLLSNKEYFESLKLVHARYNQQSYGEFVASTSQVIIAHQDYLRGDKNEVLDKFNQFLQECSALDQCGLLKLLQENDELVREELSKYNICIEGAVISDWHKSAINYLAEGKTLQQVCVETPVEVSILDGEKEDIDESSLHVEILTSLSVDSDYSAKRQPQSLEYSLTVVNSFLRLLINSRDEVAISCALASPIVKLSHDAFTTIKRVSTMNDKSYKTPIYQYILSYVTKKRLGGKGYAPPQDCPVRNFIKEMITFVDFMDKMQTILEEHEPLTAVNKIINIIFTRLCKEVREQTIKTDMIEKARDIVRSVVESLKNENIEDDKLPQGLIGRETIIRLRSISERISCMGAYMKPSKILSSPFSAATPSKTPIGAQSMFSLFKSPETLEDEEFVPLSERVPLDKANLEKKPTVHNPFHVKYEPVAPKNDSVLSSSMIDECFSQIEESPVASKPSAPSMEKQDKVNKIEVFKEDSTPVIKNSKSTKRKAGKLEPAAKKKLKMVAMEDPENSVQRGDSKEKKTKLSTRKPTTGLKMTSGNTLSKPATNSTMNKTSKSKKNIAPANQKSIASFFAKA